MVETINKTSLSDVWLSFYVGFDIGDPSYDDPHNMAKFLAAAKQVTKDYPIDFQFTRIPAVLGDVDYIWNTVLMQAYVDGCDYMYQLCDDVIIKQPINNETEPWATNFVRRMRLTKPIPNVGMVGGADFWTQPLVGRKHFDAFGTFYTHETRNYYGDTWMSDVYGTTELAINRNNYPFDNLQTGGGSRYPICWCYHIKDLVKRDGALIKSWIADERQKNEGCCCGCKKKTG